MFDHPTIKIERPAPGHHVITGHAPKPTFVEGVGHVCPAEACYISPEVPDAALVTVLEERGVLGGPDPLDLIRYTLPQGALAKSAGELANQVHAFVEQTEKDKATIEANEKELTALRAEVEQLKAPATPAKKGGK